MAQFLLTTVTETLSYIRRRMLSTPGQVLEWTPKAMAWEPLGKKGVTEKYGVPGKDSCLWFCFPTE